MELSANAEIEKLRQQIASLGKDLESLNNSKESLYREKISFDNLLSNTIAQANELKGKKKTTDEDIKTKKILRTTLNKELKELSIKIKTMQKTAATPKTKKRVSPDAAKKQIEAMQYAIETEGLSFEKEKQYMDKINQLKAELSSSNTSTGVPKELRETTFAKKTQADLVHVEIQKLAEESTKGFDQLTAKAKAIIEAKNKRAELQSKLKDIKAQIEAKNQDLAESLSQWLVVAKDMPIEVSTEMTEADVINKFKNSKKLTKDDILKLQRLALR
jgi:uncharacterized coiled-coil DUF342 family protein